jgi:hypothetical protein
MPPGGVCFSNKSQYRRRPSGGSDYRTAAAENFAHRAGAFEF